jgi:hypothetical protein
MNYTSKIISLTLLVSAAALVADATTAVVPFVSYRSQSQDLARQKAGTIGHEYKADMKSMVTDKTGKAQEKTVAMDVHNGSFVFTPEYTRSFNGDKIAESLFGCYFLQDCNKLILKGSNFTVAGGTRTEKDLQAEWFGLSSGYEGSICFEPTIQNFNADMSLYWGMDQWVHGMFFRIHAPLTWTKWNLGAKFSTTEAGTLVDGTVTYLDDAEKFFCKKETETTAGAADWLTTPLTCARFCGCMCDDNKTKTRLADIQADFGWNFLLKKDYNLGMFARVVAPTGGKVKGEWLFEPVVGNGGHWELGGGLTGSYVFWRNQEETKHFGFYVDGEITHLFNAKQNRVFDLVDKPLSRYIQAYKTVNAVETYAPLANLTSCEMNVNVAVQADVTAMFNYTCHNWSYDLGYNFWARSCEKFDCKSDCDSCDTCNSCDSCDDCCGACVIKNGNVDNWTIMTSDAINTYDDSAEVRLTDSMINYDGAKTKGMSHKVFANVNYAWTDREVVPFVGLGGFAEFGRNGSCCDDDCNSCNTCDTCSCDDECSGCTYASLSQWGLWLKGGVSF